MRRSARFFTPVAAKKFLSDAMYSNPLYTKEEVTAVIKAFQDQYPNSVLEVREHPPTDAGGYSIVSVWPKVSSQPNPGRRGY